MDQPQVNLAPFTITGEQAVLKHINIRKQGPEDEKQTVIDLKLEINVDMGPVDFIDTGLRSFLWSTEGIVRNTLIGDVSYGGTIHSCDVVLGDIEANGVSLGKVKINPKDSWRAVLTVTMTWEPTSNEIAILSDCLQDSLRIDVTQIEGLKDPAPAPSPPPGDSQGSILLTFPGTTQTGATEQDPLTSQAATLVREKQKASISMLQRNLQIGYNRAARILEALEAMKVVSAMNANGFREVL